MRDCLNTALYASNRSAIRVYAKLARETPGCISLTLGEPDFDTPAPVRAEAQAALDRGETHYIENNGLAALREKIAAFEAEKNGMDYGPDEVIVTAGATEALFPSLFGVLSPGDEVTVPTPAFVLYEEIVKLSEFKEAVQEDLARLFKENGLRGFERIKKFEITTEAWTSDNGLLTPTFKLKRNAVKAKYEETLNHLYNH